MTTSQVNYAKYLVDKYNAEVNAQNAETNRRNWEVNSRNADTNRINSAINQQNADTNVKNAQTNYLGYLVDKYQAETNRNKAISDISLNRARIDQIGNDMQLAIRQQNWAEYRTLFDALPDSVKAVVAAAETNPNGPFAENSDFEKALMYGGATLSGLLLDFANSYATSAGKALGGALSASKAGSDTVLNRYTFNYGDYNRY